MTTPDPQLLAMLEYRLGTIELGELALRHSMLWETAPPLEVFFDKKLVFEGSANAFTNSAIEAAVIHSRAILEFLGFKACSTTEKIVQITHRKKDDYAVEQFGSLEMLSKERAKKAYLGPEEDAEKALALIFHSANKGLAHGTSAFERPRGTQHF